jgi:PKD repeat protein
MIIFGGIVGQTSFGAPTLRNDVFVLEHPDGQGGTPTWIQLFPAGTPPSPRSGHAAVFDAANNRMIVFGGDPHAGFCGGAANDVWVLTNANGVSGTPTWTQLTPTGTLPNLRVQPQAVYDPVNNRMILFGGSADGCAPWSNGVWVLSNANGLDGTPSWTQLAPSGSVPSPRTTNALGYDTANNLLISFAGHTSAGHVNDLWTLENANGLGGTPVWMQLFPPGTLPSPRSTVGIYDQASNRMLIFGIFDPMNDYISDSWVLANANGIGGTPSWTQLTPTGGPPAPRNTPAVILIGANNRLVLHGGTTCSPTLCQSDNQVWVLSDALGVSNQLPVANAGADFTIIVGESAQFDGSASYDPDGTITTFHWDFDGQGTANGAIVNKLFAATGTFTVTLTVTDNQGATATDTVEVIVLSPAGAIQDLSQVVQNFNLQQGISNALDEKLQNAQSALNAENAGWRQDAANKLNAFISSVEAQRGKKLTNAQAETLVAYAQRILSAL